MLVKLGRREPHPVRSTWRCTGRGSAPHGLRDLWS